VQPEDHRNALDRKVLQKTPVLAMAQAQTCHRSRKCTKVASEPLNRRLRGRGAGNLDMKKIEAIIKPFKLEDVKNALLEVDIEGMTTMDVKGFGNQKGPAEIYRGSDYIAEFVPMVLILIVVADSVAENAVRAIQRAGKTGYFGDGKIFVSTIDEAFRIRISERGEPPI
jgi:nitrogen regulatory protein P-II 1